MKGKLLGIAAVIAACACLFASGCVPLNKPDDGGNNGGNVDNGGGNHDVSGGDDDEKYLSMLTTDGERVVNEQGDEVILRGLNLGGLFVTEHWMTGFQYNTQPKNDYLSLNRTFIERFGEEENAQLWQTYRNNWWSDVDFDNCKAMGINVIRLPFTYMNVDPDAITSLDEAGKNYDFTALDEFIAEAAEHDIYTILDMHGAYGSQNGQDHSGQIYETANEVTFYSNEQLISLTVKLWTALAEHYENNPNVAGYDLLNEPGEKAAATEKRHWDCFDRIYDGIRSTGDDHIIIFESCWDGYNLPDPEEYDWRKCIYSFHHYTGDSMSYEQFCSSWENKLKEIESHDFGVPLYMGEFTCYNNADWWDFALPLLNEHGWHWTSWTYKVWGNMAWGVVNIPNDNEAKVDSVNDDYDTILGKFEHLKTETSYFYSFGENRTLKDIIAAYSKGQTGTESE